MNIVLQPCSNKIATKHYQHTILNDDLYLNTVKSYLSDDDFKNLKKIYNEEPIKLWGVLESRNSTWEKIKVGDVALFAKNNHIISYGTICYKMRNASLAKCLWDTDEYGKTWEYIYFLTAINNYSIPYADFNRAVGYDEKNTIQGFTILNDEKSNMFLDEFPLQKETRLPKITEKDYFKIIKNRFNTTDDLDGKVQSSYRKEQSFLRDTLFKNKFTDKCALCGKEYPVEFLCCAHIKKRCLCSTEERLDYKNIVVPMCKFGCDDLYEKGFVGVKDGKVTVIKHSSNNVVDNYIDGIKNNIVERYSLANKKYFDQHLDINGYKTEI